MNLLDRPRRLRANPAMRELTAETSVEARHLITPHFVVEGSGVKQEIGSMPGVFHVSVDNLVKEVGADLELGLKTHLMFGIPDDKDPHGNSAIAPGNVCEAGVQALKQEFGYKNDMQIPRLDKIVLNIGCGAEAVKDSKKAKSAQEDLTAIAGQKAVITKAKKSIAGFRVRDRRDAVVRGDLQVDRFECCGHGRFLARGGVAGMVPGGLAGIGPTPGRYDHVQWNEGLTRGNRSVGGRITPTL